MERRTLVGCLARVKGKSCPTRAVPKSFLMGRVGWSSLGFWTFRAVFSMIGLDGRVDVGGSGAGRSASGCGAAGHGSGGVVSLGPVDGASPLLGLSRSGRRWRASGCGGGGRDLVGASRVARGLVQGRRSRPLDRMDPRAAVSSFAAGRQQHSLSGVTGRRCSESRFAGAGFGVAAPVFRHAVSGRSSGLAGGDVRRSEPVRGHVLSGFELARSWRHARLCAGTRRRLEAALGNRQGRRPKYLRKADGEFEARLVALSCGDPPEGRSQWSLRLLADRAVELGYIDSVSHETVRRVLKRTLSNRGAASAG